MPSGDAAARRAHRRLGGALLLAPEPERRRGTDGCRATRGSTPTRAAREARRARPDARRRYRVLVDANQHVDREAAARSGVGFYGKNTMLITRRHGSWVVLGTLVTDVELEPTPPLDADCGDCRLCIDACPTGALDEPGTLDATHCLSYWTQASGATAGRYRAGARRAGVRLRHLPGRVPVEPRRREAPRGRAAAGRREPHVSLVDWLQRGPGRARGAATPGSSCRATTAAGCGATRSSRPGTSAATPSANAVTAYLDDADETTARASQPGRWSGWRSADAEPPGPLARAAARGARRSSRVIGSRSRTSRRLRRPGLGARRVLRRAHGRLGRALAWSSSTAGHSCCARSCARVSTPSSDRVHLVFSFEAGEPYAALST